MNVDKRRGSGAYTQHFHKYESGAAAPPSERESKCFSGDIFFVVGMAVVGDIACLDIYSADKAERVVGVYQLYLF